MPPRRQDGLFTRSSSAPEVRRDRDDAPTRGRKDSSGSNGQAALTPFGRVASAPAPSHNESPRPSETQDAKIPAGCFSFLRTRSTETKVLKKNAPLIMAAKAGHWDVFKTLVELRADITATEISSGRSALHYFTEKDNAEAVGWILEHRDEYGRCKVDMWQEDVEGIKPVDLAIKEDVIRAYLQASQQELHDEIIQTVLQSSYTKGAARELQEMISNKCNSCPIENLSRLQEDLIEFARKVVERDLDSVKYFCNISEIMSIATQRDGELLRYASARIKNNSEVVKHAVRQNWKSLRHASRRLQNDPEIVMIAFLQDDRAFDYFNSSVRSDRHFILNAVKTSPRAFEFASEELKDDGEFVLDLVSINGYLLRFSSERLRADRKIVCQAVSQCGMVLKYVSSELRSDIFVVRTAMGQNWRALEFASEELRANEFVVMEAIKIDGCALQFASDELKQDRHVVVVALQQNWKSLEYADVKLRGDKSIVSKALRKNPNAMKFATEDLKAMFGRK
uniref:DUF4116 domain-containing protein n=1 Tax=Hanusia phi TaxID=3032 RepID=A0A7S0HVG0_9CRYP|mmetsp:Transcript_36504/g.82295  ORF Transcript_36504/g.82295 Transcript_36504/m.82295 type:complete len:509 (+) Transcript_36504:93-1619(+)